MGIPGKVRNDDVTQKKDMCSSATKIQLGSECHPGSMGFVYDEFLPMDNATAGRIDVAFKIIPSRCILVGARIETEVNGTGLVGALSGKPMKAMQIKAQLVRHMGGLYC
jgi:hypothetical protein